MKLNRTLGQSLATCVIALGTSACGSGTDPAASTPAPAPAAPAPASPAPAPAAITCDTTQFVAGAAVDATAAQISAAAKTYVGNEGDSISMAGTLVNPVAASFVFNADATATYKGAVQTIQSICWVGVDNQLVLHWSKSAGAGFYLSHIDLRTDGTASGFIAGKVFKSP